MELPDSSLADDFMRLPVHPNATNIPRTYWFDVALRLPCNKLMHFCLIGKRFAGICVDPFFWHRRLQEEFPNVNPEGLKDDQFRAKYQLALADRLDAQAAATLSQTNTDSVLRGLGLENIQKIYEIHQLRDQQEREFRKGNKSRSDDLEKEIEKKKLENDVIMKKIKDINEKLHLRADQLRKLGEAVLPVPFLAKYVIITVPRSYLEMFPEPDENAIASAFSKEITRTFRRTYFDVDKIWTWFKQNGWILPPEEPIDGLLVGIRFEGQKGSVPFALLHIYYRRGRLIFTASETYQNSNANSIPVELVPRSLEDFSIEEIQENYNLPFAIIENYPGSDEEEEEPEEDE